MKRIGGMVSSEAREALHAALDSLEAARSERGGQRPQEPPRAPQEAAAPVIRSLASERAQRRRQQAGKLVALAKSLGVQGEALQIVQRSADEARRGNETWVFVMISPAQNAAVVEWLSQHSKRPQVAVRLWAQLFAHLRSDTGEILQTRQELAERLGISAQNLSRIMTELERINAIRREKQGRQVRYFMNPNIATHLAPKAREASQVKAGPLLALMEGGRDAN